MEQKRTLWIMAAVGVFLLVVLGAALILYTPQAHSSKTITSVNGDKSVSNGWIPLSPAEPTFVPQTNEIVSITPEEEPLQQESSVKVNELKIYADNATIITKETENKENVYPTQTIINNEIGVNILDGTKPVFAKNENVVKKEVPSKKASDIAKEEKAKAVKNVQKTKTPVKDVKLVTSTPKQTVTQYWVQVSSLTSKKSADNARSTLAENKITAEVFTYKDKKDQLFYRVRVGPYTTKTEAEYWKSMISKIDNFSSVASYVTATTIEQ